MIPLFISGREAENSIFFSKKAERRYYSNEFPFQIVFQNNIPVDYLKLPCYFFSYEASKSLNNSKAALTKEDIISKEGEILKNQNMIYLSYERENFTTGAFEINTRQEIPHWSKSISLWLFDYNSGNEAALYIRDAKGLKKYSIGFLNYKGWKNFIIHLDSLSQEGKAVIEKIKFFNRKMKGGANDLNPVIKISNIEVFSKKILQRNLGPFLKDFEPGDFLFEEDSLGIQYFRLNKGYFWDKDKILSFFIQSSEPSYLEIYASLPDQKNKIFILQTSFFNSIQNARLDFKLPDDIKKKTQEGVFFWGYAVVPLKKGKIPLTVQRIVLRPEL